MAATGLMMKSTQLTSIERDNPGKHKLCFLRYCFDSEHPAGDSDSDTGMTTKN